MIRFFDILFSGVGLILLSPLFLLIYILIRMESKGGGIYSQERIGRNGIPFRLYKFRSMQEYSDKGSPITIGRDPRITRMGQVIRKAKLDELPQLWNVLRGDMSLVGPRPEVKRYVLLYTAQQRQVLTVRPGITDWASIKYVDENLILGEAEDPEKVYCEQIMPDKIRLNMIWVKNQSIGSYFKIIISTISLIISRGRKFSGVSTQVTAN